MALFRRILSLNRRARMEREIDAELREHMAMSIDDNMAQGMSREAAERDARRRFGNPQSCASASRRRIPRWGLRASGTMCAGPCASSAEI